MSPARASTRAAWSTPSAYSANHLATVLRIFHNLILFYQKYLSNGLIQSSSHCSKDSSIVIIDAFVKLVDQIFRSFKWFVRQCTVDCFMSQVQEQWLGGIMWIDQIHSLVCKKICAVVSPLIVNRLWNLQREYSGDSSEIKLTDEIFSHFVWMFSAMHCFETEYNKKDRSPSSQKRYDELILLHLCLY